MDFRWISTAIFTNFSFEWPIPQALDIAWPKAFDCQHFFTVCSVESFTPNLYRGRLKSDLSRHFGYPFSVERYSSLGWGSTFSITFQLDGNDWCQGLNCYTWACDMKIRNMRVFANKNMQDWDYHKSRWGRGSKHITMFVVGIFKVWWFGVYIYRSL